MEKNTKVETTMTMSSRVTKRNGSSTKMKTMKTARRNRFHQWQRQPPTASNSSRTRPQEPSLKSRRKQRIAAK